MSKRSRQLKLPSYKSFRLSPRIKHAHKPLPSAWQLLKSSIQDIRQQWRFFGGVAVIYGVLLMLFVGNLPASISTAQNQQLAGNTGTSSLSALGTLFNSSSTSSDVASLYQFIILILCSLAIIWGLRRVRTSKKERLSVKDAFYKGMYPLIPALVVVFIMGFELLPLAFASAIYSNMIVGGLALLAAEKAFWGVLTILLALLSLYLLSSSVIAFYIATLPDMAPLQALRGAKKLVIHRRFVIIRKVLWLFLIVLLSLGLIIIPVINFAPIAAGVIVFVAAIIILPITHAYMYNLYRALL
jgi:hypothetical protein